MQESCRLAQVTAIRNAAVPLAGGSIRLAVNNDLNDLNGHRSVADGGDLQGSYPDSLAKRRGRGECQGWPKATSPRFEPSQGRRGEIESSKSYPGTTPKGYRGVTRQGA